MNLNELITTINRIKQDMDERALVLGTVQVQTNSEGDYSISSFNVLTLAKFNQMFDNSELTQPRIISKRNSGFAFNNKF